MPGKVQVYPPVFGTEIMEEIKSWEWKTPHLSEGIIRWQEFTGSKLSVNEISMIIAAGEISGSSTRWSRYAARLSGESV